MSVVQRLLLPMAVSRPTGHRPIASIRAPMKSSRPTTVFKLAADSGRQLQADTLLEVRSLGQRTGTADPLLSSEPARPMSAVQRSLPVVLAAPKVTLCGTAVIQKFQMQLRETENI